MAFVAYFWQFKLKIIYRLVEVFGCVFELQTWLDLWIFYLNLHFLQNAIFKGLLFLFLDLEEFSSNILNIIANRILNFMINNFWNFFIQIVFNLSNLRLILVFIFFEKIWMFLLLFVLLCLQFLQFGFRVFNWGLHYLQSLGIKISFELWFVLNIVHFGIILCWIEQYLVFSSEFAIKLRWSQSLFPFQPESAFR